MKIKIIDGVEYVKFEEVKQERRARVDNVVKNLSFSEGIAAKSVFKELEVLEGVLKTSSVADKANITRSVVVQALKKLEGAGVIETQSLGMKGTHIKILDKTLLEVLKEVE